MTMTIPTHDRTGLSTYAYAVETVREASRESRDAAVRKALEWQRNIGADAAKLLAAAGGEA